MTQEPRDVLGKWLFERDYRERGLASSSDDRWERFVERNQEEWRQEADLLLEQVAKLIERGLEPIEVTLSGVDAVTAFLRGYLPPPSEDDVLAGRVDR